MISSEGIHVDQSKVQVIRNWPTPRNVKDVQSFHGLVTFYRRFIQPFSLIAAPLIDAVKKNNFVWGPDQLQSFEELKEKLTMAPVVALPDFDKLFEVEVDASCKGVGAILSQEGQPIEYFSLKLCESRQLWSTYEQEFYGLIQALRQ